MSNNCQTQIQTDIDYLSTFLDNDEQINEVIEASDKFGTGSAEYFCEEFVFVPDEETPEQVARLHDPEYLDITEFNFHHWVGNNIQEDY